MNISSRPTPIKDEYETCMRTQASLCIYPVDVEPDTITKELGVVPTKVVRKGERRFNKVLGKESFARNSFWELSSEGHVMSKDLRRHIDWIMDMIEPSGKNLLRIQQYPDLQMAIRCVWWSLYNEGGPTLWPEQMKRMAELNLELTIEFSFMGDDDNNVIS